MGACVYHENTTVQERQANEQAAIRLLLMRWALEQNLDNSGWTSLNGTELDKSSVVPMEDLSGSDGDGNKEAGRESEGEMDGDGNRAEKRWVDGNRYGETLQ